MARTSDPHSATAQFFINVADNDFLDYKAPSAQRLGLLRVRQGRRGQGRRRPDHRRADRPQAACHENVPTRRRRHRERRGSRVAVASTSERGSCSADDRANDGSEPTRDEGDPLPVGPSPVARATPAAAALRRRSRADPRATAAAVYMLGDLFDCVARRRPAARARSRRRRRRVARHQRRRCPAVRRARQPGLPARRRVCRGHRRHAPARADARRHRRHEDAAVARR